MKKIITLLLIFVSLHTVQAQRRSYMIGANYAMSEYDVALTNLQSLNIEAGVERNSGLMLSLTVGRSFATTITDDRRITVRSRCFQSSVNMGYRLGRYSSRFTVVPSLNFGSVLHNSQRESYMYNKRLSAEHESNAQSQFDKLRMYTILKVLLDYEIGRFNFRGGPSYSFGEMRMLQIERNKSKIFQGYGVEIGITVALEPRRTVYQGVFIPSKGRF